VVLWIGKVKRGLADKREVHTQVETMESDEPVEKGRQATCSVAGAGAEMDENLSSIVACSVQRVAAAGMADGGSIVGQRGIYPKRTELR
jgi:hypothetical protein